MLTDNILQLHPLQVVPDPLIRVQLGSIGGQLLQMDSLPSRAGQEGFDRLAPVDGAAIPDDHQPHRDVGGYADACSMLESITAKRTEYTENATVDYIGKKV